MDEFDHAIHEKFNVKHYGRYVDDMVLVHSDKEILKALIPKIRDYLKKELGLTLHPNKIYLQHFTKGVNFLGTYIKSYRIYIGYKTKNNFYAKIGEWNKISDKDKIKKVVAGINSYLGIMKNYDTASLRKKMVSSFGKQILKNIVFSKNFKKAELII